MPVPEIKFPVYRKYLNGRSFFRIDSMESFEEIRQLGTKWIIEKHEVKILPDRNLVHDLVYDFEKFGVEIKAGEYEQMRFKAGEK
ncbi:MAG: hypothetical protein HY064_01600 [Bacteroidetes bacterium]|nr:hypothetical protein [Bacteroidota bacterium]